MKTYSAQDFLMLMLQDGWQWENSSIKGHMDLVKHSTRWTIDPFRLNIGDLLLAQNTYYFQRGKEGKEFYE